MRWTVLPVALLVVSAGAGRAQLPAQRLPASDVKPAPPTPIAEKKAELGDDKNWNPDWDKLIEEVLPADLLSPRLERAIKPLCPQFNRMQEGDKRAYWAYFFQALAGAEAGLKPDADVRHTEPAVAVKDTVTRRMVRSEGLLQLTYMDADRYGCAFDWERDKQLPVKDPGKTILQARNNLICGVKIIENQVVNQHKPVLTRHSYWSTLRPGTPGYKVFVKQMANVPAACGLPKTKSIIQPQAVREAQIESGEKPAAAPSTAKPAGTASSATATPAGDGAPASK